eukprot:Nitzschia sp. Nitz4//scaffold55_size114948//5241//5807//NITZ4_003879-RA/size114948-snap-gene-0.163-mRNA-1//1//CDS//3329554464//7482//frame0
MLGIVLAYATMAVIYSQGGEIISMLHGSEASQSALFQETLRTRSMTTYPELCYGYSASQFDMYSNILHVMGMISTIWVAVYAMTLYFFRFGNPNHFLYLAPVYYLPSWIGHVVFQKNLPAVLSYGKTLDGLANSELCNWRALFLAVFLLVLMASGALWPQVKASPRRRKQD